MKRVLGVLQAIARSSAAFRLATVLSSSASRPVSLAAEAEPPEALLELRLRDRLAPPPAAKHQHQQ